MALKVKKDAEYSDPETVQEFIDTEHAETTYGERYHGLYDDRYLEPGGVPELLQMIQANPWPDDMLTQVHGELFGDEIAGRAERHQKRLEEYGKLQALAQGELQVHGKDFEFRGERYAHWEPIR